jgi:hypothetical protein
MTPEARKAVWRHNSFFGHCRMAESNMRAMLQSDTTTPEAKEIANRICCDLTLLRAALKTRIDQ